jgi:hypothetical protein
LRLAYKGRPNGLAFSCRERAAETCQKANDLAREAVSCNAGLGGGPQLALQLNASVVAGIGCIAVHLLIL